MERDTVELEDGHCCDCGGNLFHPGPRGACAHNIMCASCRSQFWVSPPFQPHRISNEDDAYNLRVVRTLDEITLGVFE